MAGKAFTQAVNIAIRLNTTQNQYAPIAAAVIGALSGSQNNQREERKVAPSRGPQPLSSLEEQKSFQQEEVKGGGVLDWMEQQISSVSPISVPRRDFPSVVFPVGQEQDLQSIFGINFERILRGQDQIPGYIQIILEIVKQRFFQEFGIEGEELSGASRDFDLVFLSILLGNLEVPSGNRLVKVNIAATLNQIINYIRQICRSKTGEENQIGELLKLLRSKINKTRLLRLINKPKRQPDREQRLFQQQDPIAIVSALRLQSIIVSFMSTFERAFNVAYPMIQQDSQYGARLYAFIVFIALRIQFGNLPALSDILPENQANVLAEELFDLATNQTIPNVQARLQKIPFIQTITIGAIQDVNRLLQSDIQSQDIALLDYISKRLRSSQTNNFIEGLGLFSQSSSISLFRELRITINDVEDIILEEIKQERASGIPRVRDPDLFNIDEEEKEVSILDQEEEEDRLIDNVREQVLQTIILVDNEFGGESGRPQFNISSENQPPEANQTESTPKRNLIQGQPGAQTQAQIDERRLLVQQLANNVMNQLELRVEQRVRRILLGSLSVSAISLAVSLSDSDILREIIPTIQQTITDIMDSIRRPPQKDGKKRDVVLEGGVVIKEKDPEKFKPATFILKKELEIRRRDLEDQTPIERVLAPPAQKRRGRPRKEIPPLQNLNDLRNGQGEQENER